MEKSDNITFYQSQNIGRGLPFAIVEHEKLISTNDLFVPSLRDFHVIFWVKEGGGTYFIDFKEYKIKANSLALISKDHLHYFEPFKEQCELQSIAFSPEFIYRNDTDLKHLFKFNVGCHINGVQIIQLSPEDVDFLEEISEQMKKIYYQWEGKSQSEGFYHLLCLFLLKCEAAQTSRQNIPPVTENDKFILAFNQLLEDNFKTEFKVDFYAEKLNLGIKALAKLIKEKYKSTPKVIINERRMLEIKRMLKGTTLPVKEIAYDMGFDEPTNMIKYFKKNMDQTPNEFRDSGIF